MGANPLQETIETCLGPEMATSQTRVHKITNVQYLFFYTALGLNDFDGGKSITRAIGIKITTSRAM
jgi:hypothetical protein